MNILKKPTMSLKKYCLFLGIHMIFFCSLSAVVELAPTELENLLLSLENAKDDQTRKFHLKKQLTKEALKDWFIREDDNFEAWLNNPQNFDRLRSILQSVKNFPEMVSPIQETFLDIFATDQDQAIMFLSYFFDDIGMNLTDKFFFDIIEKALSKSKNLTEKLLLYQNFEGKKIHEVLVTLILQNPDPALLSIYKKLSQNHKKYLKVTQKVADALSPELQAAVKVGHYYNRKKIKKIHQDIKIGAELANLGSALEALSKTV